MDVFLKIYLFFFLLNATECQIQSDPVTDVKSRLCHIKDDNTREILKSQMCAHFLELMKANSEILLELNSLNERTSKIEKFRIELFTNFTRSLTNSVGNVHFNLTASIDGRLRENYLKTDTRLQNLSDWFRQNLSATDLKMEKSLANLSSLLTKELRRSYSKMETSLRNISESREMRLLRNDSTVTEETGTEIETTESNQQELPFTTFSKVDSQTKIVPTLHPSSETEVEEVNLKEGTIEFTGESNSSLRRKIWVLESEAGASFRVMRFNLEENGLGPNARLSLWGSSYGDGRQPGWNGSQTDWKLQRESCGNVILLTLTISPSASEQPRFKLKYKTIDTWGGYVCSSELVLRNGQQLVSFPPNNTGNYIRWSIFVAVIVRPSGEPFALTLKYLDIPGTPSIPDSCESNFNIFLLEEIPNKLPYRKLPSSGYTRCGRVGDTSQPIGNSTVAIIHFWNNGWSVGRGFRVEIN